MVKLTQEVKLKPQQKTHLEVPLQSEVRRTSKMTPTTITAEVRRTSPKKCDAFPQKCDAFPT
jgi:hypothetical protein